MIFLPSPPKYYPIENKQVIIKREAKDRGLPKYEGMSAEVAEKECLKKRPSESLQKLLKTIWIFNFLYKLMINKEVRRRLAPSCAVFPSKKGRAPHGPLHALKRASSAPDPFTNHKSPFINPVDRFIMAGI